METLGSPRYFKLGKFLNAAKSGDRPWAGNAVLTAGQGPTRVLAGRAARQRIAEIQFSFMKLATCRSRIISIVVNLLASQPLRARGVNITRPRPRRPQRRGPIGRPPIPVGSLRRCLRADNDGPPQREVFRPCAHHRPCSYGCGWFLLCGSRLFDGARPSSRFHVSPEIPRRGAVSERRQRIKGADGKSPRLLTCRQPGFRNGAHHIGGGGLPEG